MTTILQPDVTKEAPRMCIHLRSGQQHTYMKVEGAHWCLDCVAQIYRETKDMRYQAAWLIVENDVNHRVVTRLRQA